MEVDSERRVVGAGVGGGTSGFGSFLGVTWAGLLVVRGDDAADDDRDLADAELAHPAQHLLDQRHVRAGEGPLSETALAATGCTPETCSRMDIFI